MTEVTPQQVVRTVTLEKMPGSEGKCFAKGPDNQRRKEGSSHDSTRLLAIR